MRHLSTEELARLVDEAPTQEERRHLAGCRRCVAELDALREQTEALAGLPDVLPPSGDWRELEGRLVAEGLLRPGRGGRSRGFAGRAGWLQAAAAVILFLGGTGTGVLLARGAGPGEAGGDPAAVTRAAGPDDAARILQSAEERYVDALLQYRRLAESEGTAGGSADPASRFAALEALVAAGQAAVRHAPTDPFINGVLVSTMAERQATLREISTADTENWF